MYIGIPLVVMGILWWARHGRRQKGGLRSGITFGICWTFYVFVFHYLANLSMSALDRGVAVCNVSIIRPNPILGTVSYARTYRSIHSNWFGRRIYSAKAEEISTNDIISSLICVYYGSCIFVRIT